MEEKDRVRDVCLAEYSEEQALRTLGINIDEAIGRDSVDVDGDAIYETIQILVNGTVHAFMLTGSVAAGMMEFIKKVCSMEGFAYPWPEQ